MYFYRKTPVKSNCFFRDDRRYRWKITGEASNNSGGGVRVVFATTNSPTALPDIHDALRLAHPDDAWYWIESVICEGPVRSIFDDEPSIWKPAYRKVVANV